MDGCGADDFDGGYVCNVAKLFVDGFDLLFGEFGVSVYGVSSSAVKRKLVFSVLIVLESHISFVSVNASLSVDRASVDTCAIPAILWCFASNSLRLSGILRYGCRQFASGACLPPG